MEILIKTSDGSEAQRWGGDEAKPLDIGRIKIPGTNDVVYIDKGVPRPHPVGPNHFLATATAVDDPIGADEKRGPEVLTVVGQNVTLTRPAVPKTAEDLEIEWKMAMAAMERTMPRHLENHIEFDHSGVAADPYQQKKYDEKKALRINRP